jgi:hypothetical protein
VGGGKAARRGAASGHPAGAQGLAGALALRRCAGRSCSARHPVGGLLLACASPGGLYCAPASSAPARVRGRQTAHLLPLPLGDGCAEGATGSTARNAAVCGTAASILLRSSCPPIALGGARPANAAGGPFLSDAGKTFRAPRSEGRQCAGAADRAFQDTAGRRGTLSAGQRVAGAAQTVSDRPPHNRPPHNRSRAAVTALQSLAS